jgi:hypothetical protein
VINDILYIEGGIQHIPFDILSLINHSVEDLKQLSIQAIEAYVYGAKLPTLPQILAQLATATIS